MVQKKILLDSNVYFRLAYNIHPLLFVEFGDENYCLYVIDELVYELKNNPRLKNKFDWVMLKKFVENRKHPINIGSSQREEIERAFDLMWGASKHTGVSEIDVKAVATAYILKIKLISDDAGVQELAKEYEVICLSTLEILKLMFDNDHIDMEKVRQTVTYCQYDNDFPHKFTEEYKALFNEELPPWDYEGE
jgi:hypothetical protein